MIQTKTIMLLRLMSGLIFLNLSLVPNALAQGINFKFGEGVYIAAPDSSADMRFSTRFQNLFEANNTLTNGQPNDDFNSKFLVRRARLKFDGFAYSPRLEYKIELGMSNRDIGQGGDNPNFDKASNIILDAVLKWNVYHNFSLWFGQTKLPGNRERVISSQDLQFVDRSAVNANFNIDRDKGIWLHHHFNMGKVLFREAVAVTLGEGRNVTSGSGDDYSYTARLEMLPFGNFDDYVSSDLTREKRHRLSVGVDYNLNMRSRRVEGQTGAFIPDESLAGNTEVMHADLMYKFSGLSIMAEYSERMLMSDYKVNPYVTGSGLSAQMGYLFPNYFEIAGRVTQIALEKSNDFTMYTLGFSRYIVGHSLKVQSDISYTDYQSSPGTNLMFRFQVEVGL